MWNLYLLLELLVDCIHCVFDGNTLQIPCSDFKAKWEMQINLLKRRVGEELLQYGRVFYRIRRGVESPIYLDQQPFAAIGPLTMTAIFRLGKIKTHQFSFWVSFAISSSFPSFSVPWLASCTNVFNVLQTPCIEEANDEHLPRSAMLKTPDALELVLR